VTDKARPLTSKSITTHSIKKRKSKVTVQDFATPFQKERGMRYFLNTLPALLAAQDFNEVVAALTKAHRTKKTVVFGVGAHVIKVGLSPIIIDLIERGVIKGLAFNGAGVVHDFEIAFAGKTSEDVDSEIDSGTFGMAEETGKMINEAINGGVKKGWGIGQSVGDLIAKSQFPYKELSLFAACHRLNIPVTVHVALGTDIFHFHPGADWSLLGEGGNRDFRIFTDLVSSMEEGVYVNIGSAVVLPEVFLKALTVARNLGHKLEKLTTVNMDFIQHYRPLTNVVRRPTQKGGKGYSLTGHHEIMVPLLAAALIEELG
jgi:hypothetical protein